METQYILCWFIVQDQQIDWSPPIIRNKCRLFLTSSLDRSIFELSYYVGLSFWASFRSGSTFTRAVTRCWQRQRFTSKLFFSVETFPPESWMICSRPPLWQNLSEKIWTIMFAWKLLNQCWFFKLWGNVTSKITRWTRSCLSKKQCERAFETWRQ